MALAAAAMLAKEHGVTVIGVCLLYDVFILSWPTIKRYVTISSLMSSLCPGPLSQGMLLFLRAIQVLCNAFLCENLIPTDPLIMLITLEHAPS